MTDLAWWEWLLIGAFVVWVFTVRGFSGLGQPSNPPFPQVWRKVRGFLDRKFGPFK